MTAKRKLIKIALAGQPNVGKSALINSIGNARLKVGNFSGVTVKKEIVRFSKNGYDFEIIDLPGSYSLTDYTIEERVTREYLDHEDYDLILNVVDSVNIERNLYLTTELLSLNKKMLVALNMTDEAVTEGIEINEQQLGKILGVPCVKTSAVKGTGIDEIIAAVIQSYEVAENNFHIQFSEPFEQEVYRIVAFLKEKKIQCKISLNALVIKLLREDKEAFLRFHDEPVWVELQPMLNDAYQHLYLHYDTKDLDDIFNDEKMALAKGAVAETVQFRKTEKKNLTEKIDSLLMHQFIGLPIFLLLMWGLFQLTFEVGSIPMDWIDAFFSVLIFLT